VDFARGTVFTDFGSFLSATSDLKPLSNIFLQNITWEHPTSSMIKTQTRDLESWKRES
jgi:hypothetical protein